MPYTTQAEIAQGLEAIGEALLAWDVHAHQTLYKTHHLQIRLDAQGGPTAYGNNHDPKTLSGHADLTKNMLYQTAAARFEPFFHFVHSLPGLSYTGHVAPVTLWLKKVVSDRKTHWKGKISIYDFALGGVEPPYDSLPSLAKKLVSLRTHLSLFDWEDAPVAWQNRDMWEAKNPKHHEVVAPDVCLAHVLLALICNPKPTYADLIRMHGRRLYRHGDPTFTTPPPPRMKRFIQRLNITMPDDERYVDPYADVDATD